jgi:hypothetical protein
MRLLFLCLVVLLITGCDFFSPGEEPPAGGTSTPLVAQLSASLTPSTLPANSATRLATPISLMPTSIATALVSVPATLSMSAAWGEQVTAQVKHIPLTSGDNYFLIPQSSTQDGKFLLAALNPPDVGEENPNQHASVVMIDIASGQATEIAQTPNSAVQPYGICGDENWIIWTQAAQEPGFFSNWILYAYNRNDRSTHEIARVAKDKDGLPALGSDGSAKIDHGRVVWVEAVPDSIGVQDNLVKMMDMQTGHVETLATNGYNLRISWPNVVWVEVQSFALLPGSPTPTSDEIKATVVVFDIETGAKKTLTKPEKPSYIYLYKDSLVWISADHNRLLLTDLNETFEQTIAVVRGGDYFQEPFMNDRLITWGNQMGEAIVWDRKQNRLITVASKDATQFFVTARNLVWVAPNSNSSGAPSEISVLDTTQIP